MGLGQNFRTEFGADNPDYYGVARFGLRAELGGGAPGALASSAFTKPVSIDSETAFWAFAGEVPLTQRTDSAGAVQIVTPRMQEATRSGLGLRLVTACSVRPPMFFVLDNNGNAKYWYHSTAGVPPPSYAVGSSAGASALVPSDAAPRTRPRLIDDRPRRCCFRRTPRILRGNAPALPITPGPGPGLNHRNWTRPHGPTTGPTTLAEVFTLGNADAAAERDCSRDRQNGRRARRQWTNDLVAGRQRHERVCRPGPRQQWPGRFLATRFATFTTWSRRLRVRVAIRTMRSGGFRASTSLRMRLVGSWLGGLERPASGGRRHPGSLLARLAYQVALLMGPRYKSGSRDQENVPAMARVRRDSTGRLRSWPFC